MLTIRKLMHDATLTQAELAELADISPASIGKYVSGQTKPHRENLMKLANALDWKRDPNLLFAEANDYGEGYEQEETTNDTDVVAVKAETPAKKPTGSEIKALVAAVREAERAYHNAERDLWAAEDALNNALEALE